MKGGGRLCLLARQKKILKFWTKKRRQRVENRQRENKQPADVVPTKVRCTTSNRVEESKISKVKPKRDVMYKGKSKAAQKKLRIGGKFINLE